MCHLCSLSYESYEGFSRALLVYPVLGMSSSFRSGYYPLSGLNAAIYAVLLLLGVVVVVVVLSFCANVYCFLVVVVWTFWF